MTKEEIKKLRLSLGESQEVFAARLYVSKSTVYNWERGRNISRGSQKRLQELNRFKNKDNRKSDQKEKI